MENNKNKKSVKFQGDMLNFYDFIQVFVFTTNHHLNSYIRLFADDTTLYIIVDTPAQAAFTLNQDHVKISSWADKWLVSFNPKKN